MVKDNRGSQIENENSVFKLFSVDGTDASSKIKIKPVKHKVKLLRKEESVENEESLSPAVLNGLDDKLSLFTDIDGIFGPISLSDFGNAFAHNLEIRMTESEIKTKTEYVVKKGLPTKLADIAHVQLGVLDLPAGYATVFYMCPGHQKDVEKGVIISYLSSVIKTADMVKRHTSGNSTKTIVNSDVLSRFMELLLQASASTRLHRNDFIFVETFGNKHKTVIESSTNIEKIEETLARNINREYFPHLKIDLAISISAKNSVVFPCMDLFRVLNAGPNYFLFMNKNLANSHGNTAVLSDGSLIMESAVFEKRNFYSTVEDLLAPARDRSYMPEVSSAIMKSSIAEHAPISDRRSLNNQYDKLANMIVMLRNAGDRPWPYRLEVRIRPENIYHSIETIRTAISKTSVLAYECLPFFQIVATNAQELLQRIEVTDVGIQRLFKSIFFEHLLIDGFLKGSPNMNTLPRVLHDYAKTLISFNKDLFRMDFGNSTDILANVSPDDVHRTFEKIITYDKAMNDIEKNLLKTILGIPKLNLSDAAESIVKQYCLDLGQRYKISSGFNASDLQTLSHPSETCAALPVKHVDLVIIHQFGASSFTAWKKLPYRCMTALYLQENPHVASESLLNEIKNVFSRWNLDMAFNITKDVQKPSPVFSKLINTTGHAIRPNVFDEQLKKESKENLIAELRNKIEFVSRVKKNVAWSDEEIIRLLAGRRIYQNLNGSMKGVWGYLHESSLFGFLFTRTEALMRDAMTRIHTRFNEAKINEFYQRAEIWQPENYSVSDIVDNFYKFGVILNSDAVAAFKDLHSFDLREYKLASAAFNEHTAAPERIPLPVTTSQSLDIRSFKSLINNVREQITAEIKEQIMESEARIKEEINRYIDEKRFDVVESRNSIEFDMNNGSIEFGETALDSLVPTSIDVSGEAGVDFTPNLSFPPNQGNSVPEQIITAVPERRADFTEDNDIVYFTKLFEKYRYRLFDSAAAWKSVFDDFSRPDKNRWNSFIEKAFNDGFISIITKNQSVFYRCNPRQLLNLKGLSHSRIMKYLKKHSRVKPVFNACVSRGSIKNNLRPDVSDWENYLDDLVLDGDLILISECPKKYKLVD